MAPRSRLTLRLTTIGVPQYAGKLAWQEVAERLARIVNIEQREERALNR